VKRYEFFTGLDDNGVRDTLEQYEKLRMWQVIAMGQDEDGFWMLFGLRYDE
jgi:hypothetical protein